MTQKQDKAKAKYIQEHDRETLKQIGKVRQQTLKKLLVYLCIDDSKPMNVASRRAVYDYVLAKKIVLQHFDFIDKITSPLWNAKLELDRLTKLENKKKKRKKKV